MTESGGTMKKAALFILKYLSVTATFFSAGALIFLALRLAGNDVLSACDFFFRQLLAISAIYAATSPITFSFRHFVKLSIISRLLIQTAVNYPILILSSFFSAG